MPNLARIARENCPPELIENSMRVCFGGNKPADFYNFKFMWVAHTEDMQPECFTLCQEISPDHVWLAYGGTVPEFRGPRTLRSFRQMIDELSKDYRLIGAQVEGHNFAMLKIYIANEFKIVGTRTNYEGRLFVEFLKEVKKETENG